MTKYIDAPERSTPASNSNGVSKTRKKTEIAPVRKKKPARRPKRRREAPPRAAASAQKTKAVKLGKSTTTKTATSSSAACVLTPIRPGLTIVCVRDHKQLAQVRNTMVHEAVRKSARFDVPMPEVTTVLSLHAGTHRHAEHAKALAASNRPSKRGAMHRHKWFEAPGGIDWISAEGLAVLRPILSKAEGWVIIEQPVHLTTSPCNESGLAQLGAAAKVAGVWVMLLIAHPDGRKAELAKFSTEYFDVTPCEPDPDFHMAFAVECADANYSGELGIGKVVCNIKQRGGQFKRRYGPFVAADRRTRLMAMLRKQGKTLQEIGEAVGLSKSRVSRILNAVPRVKVKTLSKAALRRLLDACAETDGEPGYDEDGEATVE